MKKITAILFWLAMVAVVKAQTTDIGPVKGPQAYGKVDQEDLNLKECDFEKGASAEVLFDVGKMNGVGQMERHIRIKIFNDLGKSYGNFHLLFPAHNGGYSNSGIFNLTGETINIDNGKVVITPLDNKQVYTKSVNQLNSEMSFALPNVKAGSIVEIKYRGPFFGVWFFQNEIPVRYSEIQTDFPLSSQIIFKTIPHVTMPYVKNEGSGEDLRQTKVLANIPSLPNEPFMDNKRNSFQRMEFVWVDAILSSWSKIGEMISYYYDRNQFVDGHVPGESDIVSQAKKLKTDNEKISFIYNYVRDYLKWNGITDLFAQSPTAQVWQTKTGNTAEINWIVFHLLKKAGITAYPFITSVSAEGKINPTIPNLYQMANMMVYVPVDSTTNYVLDASDKLNSYNTIPRENLNTFGLLLDRTKNEYKTVFVDEEYPVLQQAVFNAEITTDGKLTGTAEITSDRYNKYKVLQNYGVLGEQKYIDSLRHKDNNIKISSFKIENMDVDTLPLVQKFAFNVALSGSDENYIYAGANLFAVIGDNPFKSETRFSDIDFGYRRDFSINFIYKIPAGYKVDAMPKTITMFMPDKSIVFKRTVAEDSGTIFVRYLVDHRKAIYFKNDYPDIRAFYQKMYELLNEQIVLKKG